MKATADPGELVAFAHVLADAAAEVHRRWFRQPVAVDTKPDQSPVTIADREAEAAIRDLLARHYPGHGIWGEEYGQSGLDAELVWAIDPIDGTKSFITGRPLFGTLIALLHEGRPVIGIIDQAISRERWLGVAGRPTTHNGAPIRTRACSDLAEAVLSTTSPYLFPDSGDREAFERLARAVRLPIFGGDCYAYGLLAMGFTDLVLEADLDPYDYLAMVPVIEGAGGRFTDWQGRPLGLASDGRVLAAGDARLHTQALAVVGGG